MKKKVIKLTESQLNKVIKRTISEGTNGINEFFGRFSKSRKVQDTILNQYEEAKSELGGFNIDRLLSQPASGSDNNEKHNLIRYRIKTLIDELPKTTDILRDKIDLNKLTYTDVYVDDLYYITIGNIGLTDGWSNAWDPEKAKQGLLHILERITADKLKETGLTSNEVEKLLNR